MPTARATLLVSAAVLGYLATACREEDPQGPALQLEAAAARVQACRPASQCRLVFTVQPGNTAANATIAPAVVVTVQDPFGNTVAGFQGNVLLAIATGPARARLSGTRSVQAQSGVATFSDLSIDLPGAGYTLRASSGPIAADPSAAFIISGPATQLAFTGQPGNTAALATIAPAVAVSALDALGNPAVDFSGGITLSLTAGTGTPGATLSGTTTRGASFGAASYSDLSVDLAGAGYTLTASATGLVAATSAAFDITGGGATHLVFTVQPGNTQAGAAISPAVQVSALDAFGNLDATFAGNIVVAIATNPSGGTLSGTFVVTAIAGVAGFSNVSIDKAGAGYTLVASAAGLTGATSAAFNILGGPATHLVFTVQPSTSSAGAAFVPAVEVSARDPFGNLDPFFLGNVTIAIATNPAAGTLSGTTIVAPGSGVAAFANLSIDKAGAGYTLVASAAGLTGATSAAFDILAGPATHLVFIVQPSNTAAFSTITPHPQVAAEDAFGNIVLSFTGNVTVAIAVNPGGGVLSGTTTVAASAGVGTFPTLSIDAAGSGYQLSANSPGLVSGLSVLFNVF
jgi:hypothetical protein